MSKGQPIQQYDAETGGELDGCPCPVNDEKDGDRRAIDRAASISEEVLPYSFTCMSQEGGGEEEEMCEGQALLRVEARLNELDAMVQIIHANELQSRGELQRLQADTLLTKEALMEVRDNMKDSQFGWSLLIQVLGMAGLAETLFEIVYVNLQSSFKPFERWLFLLCAVSELVGEVLAVCGLLYASVLVWRSRSNDGSGRSTNSSNSSNNNSEPPTGDAIGSLYCERGGLGNDSYSWLQVAQVLVKDPIHNMAAPVPRSFTTDARILQWYHSAVFWGVCVSVMVPAMYSASFWPVLPGTFEEDRELRWGMCASFWVFVTAMAALLMCVGSCISVSVVVLYFFHKAFLAFLLFWRGDRLANGAVGEVLRALQIAELSSAAIVIWRTVSRKEYAKSLNEAMYGSYGGASATNAVGSWCSCPV